MLSNFRYDLYPTGRKNCSKCGAWKRLHEFGAYSARGEERLRAKAWCRTCERLRGRVVNAKARGYDRPFGKRGDPGVRYSKPQPRYCAAGHRLTGSGRCRLCKNEYDRIWAAKKRREAGVGELDNNRWRNRQAPKNQDDPHRVPAGPFRDWVKERIEWIDCTKEEFAARTGIDARNIYGLLHGEYQTIHIDTVDRALINELGTPWLLNELYPLEDDE